MYDAQQRKRGMANGYKSRLYQTKKGKKIMHLENFRIKNERELRVVLIDRCRGRNGR